MPPPAPHHRACARCIVRIDVHRSSDRVKDASPERGQRFFVPAPGARDWFSRARRRSPPRRPKDIRCHRRVAAVEEPRRSAGRPRSTFRQSPAKSPAFPKTGMPFTASNAKVLALREGIAPSGLRAGALSHAAHTCFSVWKEVLLMGIARSRCGHPRVRDGNLEVPRVQTPLLPADPDRAWD